MGELKVEKLAGGAAKTKYINHLLSDIASLEQMLEQGKFEKSPLRIGAEQEFCLVNESWEPANTAMEILKILDDPKFTNELALYNLEVNLDPLELTGDCFSKMHDQLNGLLDKVRGVAEKYKSKVLLTGILPTIDHRHLTEASMTPLKRYQILDKTIKDLRGDKIELHIKGVDEINLHHDSILFEGCNTSFQSHLQIDVDDFEDTYNWAQTIAGPVLSICANSPILLGRELWQETRIALFTQSVDSRASTNLLNEREARVNFGRDWAKGSVADFYKESVVRFRSLLNADFGTNSFSELEKGLVPKLKALHLHNGTVYKWNRVCYGITGGKPHIRIENRYMPSGPTTMDEIANMMFWVGLMRGRPKQYKDIRNKIDFKDVKSNFYNAARYGTAAQFYWEGRLVPCKELLLDELLPMAYRGLYAMNVLPEDAEKYLSVIENRIKTRNGARWIVESFRKLKKEHKTHDVLHLLTSAMYQHERKGYTIDAWELARGNEFSWDANTRKVRQLMNTDIISAQEDDSAEMVLKIMYWKHIHHLPIMNSKMDLVGLLSWTDVKHFMANPKSAERSINKMMRTELITIDADARASEAKALMEAKHINCLPVMGNHKLLGILTSKDV